MNTIKEIRDSLGLTQSDLANELGITQGSVNHYENNRRTPDIDMCREIVAALNKNGASVALDDVFPPKEEQAA